MKIHLAFSRNSAIRCIQIVVKPHGFERETLTGRGNAKNTRLALFKFITIATNVRVYSTRRIEPIEQTHVQTACLCTLCIAVNAICQASKRDLFHVFSLTVWNFNPFSMSNCRWVITMVYLLQWNAKRLQPIRSTTGIIFGVT